MLFSAWLRLLGSRVINSPHNEHEALNKILQLSRAAEVGLQIPDTLVTNDGSVARAFSSTKPAITKTLTPSTMRMLDTRRVAARTIGRSLECAPAMFQTELEKTSEIRAVIVDHDVLPVEIRTKRPEAHIDRRLDLAPHIVKAVLPSDIVAKLLQLVDRFSLRYAGADLLVQPDGRFVFLELNPRGSFDFAEIHGKQPISARMATALMGTA